jgi:cytidylate kinase
MAIITISRGSHSMGKAVAEKVAERLEYECLSRDVLLEASGKFNIPEIKLEHAFQDPPSVLERFTHGHKQYVAYIQSALTRHMCRDNVVYHGLAGHLLLKNISRVLKVRIIADHDRRVAIVMDREKISRKQAETWITKIDRTRRRWTQSLYGVDPWDPNLYDLVIKLRKLEVDDAVELICCSVKMPQFQNTAESRQEMADLALACEIKADLVDKYPDVSVSSKYGNILVYGITGERSASRVKARVVEICSKMDGVNNIEVHTDIPAPDGAV